MKNPILLLIFLLLPTSLIFSQGNDGFSRFTTVDQKASMGQVTQGNSYYKHFKGTVGDDVVNVNFRFFYDSVCATAHLEKQKITLRLDKKLSSPSEFTTDLYDGKLNLYGSANIKIADNALSGSWKINVSDTEQATKPFSAKEDYSNSVQFKQYHLSDKYHLKDNKKFPFIKISLDYLHPVAFKDPVILAKVRKYIEKSYFGELVVDNAPDENLLKKRDFHFTDYKNIEKMFRNIPEMNYVYMREIVGWMTIVYNEDDLLSLIITNAENMGGEAASGGTFYHVLNLKTGRKITEEDIFKPNFKAQLSNMLKSKIAEAVFLTPETLGDNDYFVEEIAPNENFYVDRNGIGYYFNAFEVHERPINVYFTFSELKDLLKPQSVISYLF